MADRMTVVAPVSQSLTRAWIVSLLVFAPLAATAGTAISSWTLHLWPILIAFVAAASASALFGRLSRLMRFDVVVLAVFTVIVTGIFMPVSVFVLWFGADLVERWFS